MTFLPILSQTLSHEQWPISSRSVEPDTMICLSQIFNLTPQMVIYGCVNFMSTDRIGNKDKT